MWLIDQAIEAFYTSSYAVLAPHHPFSRKTAGCLGALLPTDSHAYAMRKKEKLLLIAYLTLHVFRAQRKDHRSDTQWWPGHDMGDAFHFAVQIKGHGACNRADYYNVSNEQTVWLFDSNDG